MIRLKHVTKRFGATQALVDVDLDVARGDSVGLTGANGSGRTTLLRIVATLGGRTYAWQRTTQPLTSGGAYGFR